MQGKFYALLIIVVLSAAPVTSETLPSSAFNTASSAPSTKLIGEILEYCQVRIRAAEEQCRNLCGSDGISEFDAGFCATSTKCACVSRDDSPGVQ